ncbi:MAG: MucR family transcriptional regulator [Caldilineaceae bacterium]|nr:MucR family transcriptional regulator [Caldilineaceae bacterium]
MPRRKADGTLTCNFACLDCGAPVCMPNARCEACKRPHQLAHKRAYAKQRGHPERKPLAPRPQANPALPPYGQMIYDDDGERVQCHVCGAFYRALGHHVESHGMSAAQYRAEYDIARKQTLNAPSITARLREASLARDAARHMQGAQERPPLRPRGVNNRLQSRIRMRDENTGRTRRAQNGHSHDASH